MKDNSIKRTIYSYSHIYPKKIIIKYPEYISNKELDKLQNKYTQELNNIEKSHIYIQQQNNLSNNKSKRNSFLKYLKEFNNSENNIKDNSQINSDIFIKKHLMNKIKNKRVNNPRKYLETKNTFFPSNLLDYIHPFEYLFNHKLKNKNKNKKLELHLSDIDDVSNKTLFHKKINSFSRNNRNLNITHINKTEIQKNSANIKQKRIKTENNIFNTNISKIKTKSRNKQFFISTEGGNTSNKKLFITDASTRRNNRKKAILKNLSNINQKLNKIQQELKDEKDPSYNDIKINDNKEGVFKNDKMINKLLSNNTSMKNTDELSIKILFRELRKKNYFNELNRQYTSYNKRTYRLPGDKNFLKELLKMDIREKREVLLNHYYYQNNYIIKKAINDLQENSNSKIRKKFNKKITKMKNMNINFINSFYKHMNN